MSTPTCLHGRAGAYFITPNNPCFSFYPRGYIEGGGFIAWLKQDVDGGIWYQPASFASVIQYFQVFFQHFPSTFRYCSDQGIGIVVRILFGMGRLRLVFLMKQCVCIFPCPLTCTDCELAQYCAFNTNPSHETIRAQTRPPSESGRICQMGYWPAIIATFLMSNILNFFRSTAAAMMSILESGACPGLSVCKHQVHSAILLLVASRHKKLVPEVK